MTKKVTWGLHSVSKGIMEFRRGVNVKSNHAAKHPIENHPDSPSPSSPLLICNCAANNSNSNQHRNHCHETREEFERDRTPQR
ncbi:hypothetical protein RJT34_24410 [Clitoria ternatea]|uniref:Uncharacterized protein n=1 Tax=Clitoria ternatea TaxID=43366 RepID=A0AAN9FQQ7_CLITE